MNNVIDVPATTSPAEDKPPTQALAIRESQSVGLFGTNDPGAVIEKATSVANALKAVIVKQGLVSNIQGKLYPKCEAWTLLGTMLGVFPVTVWTRQVDGGWEARVEARTRDGATIGAAEAQCLKSERNWGNRDDFALRSMAQTRATAKCLRMPLGFVMTLSGFEPTPSEEMPHEPAKPPRSAPPAPRQPPPPPRKVQEAIFADLETRKRFIAAMADLPHTLEFYHKLHNPSPLLENETLEDLPVEYVPVTTKQLALARRAVIDFGDGLEAKHPFQPNPLPPEKGKKPAPESAKTGDTKPAPHLESVKKDPEWFWDVIITVPRKGTKKVDYDKSPDTILSLYEAMKAGDQEAQSRLWGLAHHWDAAPREFKGKTYPPSEADKVCRQALDAFVDHEEKRGDDAQQEFAGEEPTPF